MNACENRLSDILSWLGGITRNKSERVGLRFTCLDLCNKTYRIDTRDNFGWISFGWFYLSRICRRSFITISQYILERFTKHAFFFFSLAKQRLFTVYPLAMASQCRKHTCEIVELVAIHFIFLWTSVASKLKIIFLQPFIAFLWFPIADFFCFTVQKWWVHCIWNQFDLAPVYSVEIFGLDVIFVALDILTAHSTARNIHFCACGDLFLSTILYSNRKKVSHLFGIELE